jgi:hypothetical protein
MRYTTRTDLGIAALSVILPVMIMIGGTAARSHTADQSARTATASPRIGWSPAPATMPPDMHRAIVACRGLSRGDMARCIDLALRPPYHVTMPGGASADVPSGLARVRECRTQYRGTELHTCIWQPLSEQG